MTMMKAYTVLGVAPSATVAEIKAAYREKAREIHPDRFAADPRQAAVAHEAFVQLNAAFRTALAMAQRVPEPTPVVPTQRKAPSSRPSAAGPARAATSPRPAPAASVRSSVPSAAPAPGGSAPGRRDPVLTLLTVPQRCGRPWSARELEVWALTVVPEARQHLGQARKLARASGAREDRHVITATAHALLTLTLEGMNGPRVMGVLGRIDAAYDALEIVLPRDVVDRLPERVTARRALEPTAADDTSRTLLAFCAAAGALAAATAWTHFFGFFVG